MTYLGHLIVLILLLAGCVLTALCALATGITGHYETMLRFASALSRSSATLFGYSGVYSLSAEWGKAGGRGERFVDALLGKGHCKAMQQREGLL